MKKGVDPGLDPDPLVRGTDPGIRIRTKMSRIPNTAHNLNSHSFEKNVLNLLKRNQNSYRFHRAFLKVMRIK